jgi:hypothetical protein
MSASTPPVIRRAPILPERIRRTGTRGFAYVPHPFLRDGFYASLTPDELALYLLLVLVGDRNGLSFYHFDSLCSLLQMTLERYLSARDGLIDKDLLARRLPLPGPRTPGATCDAAAQVPRLTPRSRALGPSHHPRCAPPRPRP